MIVAFVMVAMLAVLCIGYVAGYWHGMTKADREWEAAYQRRIDELDSY